MNLQLSEAMQSDINGLDFENLADLETSEILNGIDYDAMLEKYASRFGIFEDDFATYRFRPHAIGHIMGGIPKPLTERQTETLQAFQEKIDVGKRLTEKQYVTYGSLLEKQNALPKLSDGAKTYLKKLFKEITFYRTEEIKSKYLDKGIIVEAEAIEMLNGLLGTEYAKNADRFQNDYFTGEPDIIAGDTVIDIKSSWDYTTFPMMDSEIENKLYYYQIHAYMDLLDLEKGKVVYVLVDTPFELILEEKKRVSWKLGLFSEELKHDLPEDLEFEIERNLTYADIPHEARVKIFEIERDEKTLEQMKQMIQLARAYLVELNQSLASKIADWASRARN